MTLKGSTMVAPATNNKVNFTKRFLEKLSPIQSGKRLYVYDLKINGLAVSVTSTGTKKLSCIP